MNAFKQCGIQNLNSLLVEKMNEYEYDYVHEHLVHTTLVLRLGLEINGLDDDTKNALLFEHQFTKTRIYHRTI